MTLDDIVNPPARKSAGSRKADLERTMVTIGSSLVAVIVALVISGILLAVTGKDPFAALAKLGEVATDTDKLYEAVSRSMPFIMSAVAFAVTAKLGLFNIGVEGQFLMGMFWAAVIGAYVDLPPVIHIPFVIVIGMLAGAAWGGIAGYLKVKRGVNEVISTIMLNAIALQIIDWLFNDFFRYDDGSGSLDVRTKQLPESAWMPDIIDDKLNGFIVVVLLVVVVVLRVGIPKQIRVPVASVGPQSRGGTNLWHQCQPDGAAGDADLRIDRRIGRLAVPDG